MKKCVSTCIFFPNNKINKYDKVFLTIPLTMNLLPDFDLLIYYDESVPNYMIEEYKKFNFIKLIKKEKSLNRSGCFWRYEAYNDYDFCYFRDIDVSIEENDIQIINHFLNSEKNICWVFLVHARKSYPKQGFVMGGVFGIKKNNKIIMNELLNSWENKAYYGSDEEFLSLKLYNLCNPICYYEPRKCVKDNVKLKNDFEEYFELEKNFELKLYNLNNTKN